MTALAAERAASRETWKSKIFTLASGTKAWKNAAVGLNSAGKVVPMTSTTAVLFLGLATKTVDAASADKELDVELPEEIEIVYFKNATSGDAVASTDIGKPCYFADDQTVAITGAGKAFAGIVYALDSNRGVGVRLSSVVNAPSALQPAVGSYTSNDYAPATIINGAIYDVPTTAANSTITLPTAAPDGTECVFVADGTKNGHTVTYRDETGPTAITAALTASKRHRVALTKLGGKWFATSTVSP